MNAITTQNAAEILENQLKSKLIAEFPNSEIYHISIEWLIYTLNLAHICPYCGEFSLKLNKIKLHCPKCANKVRSYAYTHQEISSAHKLIYTYWNANRTNLHLLNSILRTVYTHIPDYGKLMQLIKKNPDISINDYQYKTSVENIKYHAERFELKSKDERKWVTIPVPTIKTDSRLLESFLRELYTVDKINIPYLIYICQQAKICPYCGEESKDVHIYYLYCPKCDHKIRSYKSARKQNETPIELLIARWTKKPENYVKLLEKINSLFPSYQLIVEAMLPAEIQDQLDAELKAYLSLPTSARL